MKLFIKESDKNQSTKGLYNIALLLVSCILFITGCQGGETPVLSTTSETSQVASTPTAEATLVEPTSTLVPTSTPEPTPTFDISTVNDWGNSRLIFNLEERSFGEKTYQGIFQLDLNTEALSEISPAGTQLLDVSPDHQGLLISNDSELSLLNLETGSTQKLADDYFFLSPSGAKWDHSSNLIYYLAEDSTNNKLIQVNPVNGEIKDIPTNSIIAILDAIAGTIILEKGTCNPFGDCAFTDIQWIDDQGNETYSAEAGDEIILPCQRTDEFVYASKTENGGVSLHIKPHDQTPETVFWSLLSEYADCSWSPDGNRLAVIVIDRFWYSGSIQEFYFQLLFPGNNTLQDLSFLNAPLDHVTWSPDGRYTAFSGTNMNEDHYQITISLMEVNSHSVMKFDQLSQLRSENYLTIPQLFWAP